jgi:hypothetical protein
VPTLTGGAFAQSDRRVFNAGHQRLGRAATLEQISRLSCGLANNFHPTAYARRIIGEVSFLKENSDPRLAGNLSL